MRLDLPIASESLFNQQPLTLIVVVLLDLRLERRARTDETHIALKNVNKLRDFVERGLSQNVSNACNSRVFVVGIHARSLGINYHRSEFIDMKLLAILSENLK